jgi:hypothetical protein
MQLSSAARKQDMPFGAEMISDNATAIAAELMLEFARRTVDVLRNRASL